MIPLADMFENFRKTCKQYYSLEPCHYFSMLKMTKVRLELLTDVDKYQFIERGMQGGVSYIE